MDVQISQDADSRNMGIASGAVVPSAMLSVDDVAKMLRCSSRTVYRLSDSGRMPRPVKLGALVRWPRDRVSGWIDDGCPNCRDGRSGRSLRAGKEGRS